LCGCINGVTTKGIFGSPSTAMTAVNICLALTAAKHELDSLLFHVLLLSGFGAGAFISGISFPLIL
jgi:hypothetical protein